MLVVTNFKRKIMKAYIRENTLSDNRHQNPSITYDVIVKGDLKININFERKQNDNINKHTANVNIYSNGKQ